MIIVDIVIKHNQSIKFKSERKPKVEPPDFLQIALSHKFNVWTIFAHLLLGKFEQNSTT